MTKSIVLIIYLKILQMKKEKRAEKENEAKLSQEEKIKLEQRKALAEKLKSNNKV